jgi:pimeloyl-ACP methyl ester carboxylesterase
MAITSRQNQAERMGKASAVNGGKPGQRSARRRVGLRGTDRPQIGKKIRVMGHEVHYHDIGEPDGVPVLLLHGNGSIAEEVLRALPVPRGFRWIAPDRPGYGFSAPLPDRLSGPLRQAAWLDAFLDRVKVPQVIIVAHSLAAGVALCFAGRRPDRVSRLILLAPFCRPTPHRWMPWLRIAVAPVVGGPIRRKVVPALLPLFGKHILARISAPGDVPPWLERFPLKQAARPEAFKAMAAELRSFNAEMTTAARGGFAPVPVTAIVGAADRTAPPDWHLPWLNHHMPAERIVRLADVGHAVHHAAPDIVLDAITAHVVASGDRSTSAFVSGGVSTG